VCLAFKVLNSIECTLVLLNTVRETTSFLIAMARNAFDLLPGSLENNLAV
jgi:hypothetical protein